MYALCKLELSRMMLAMAGMAHAVIGDIGLALHTDKTPTREEWDAFMVSIRAVPSRRLRMLVITDGGGPDTVQRGALVKYFAGAKVRIAVMSDALVVRGIATALSWFTDRIKIFAPENVHDAMAYLDLSKEQCDTVKERLRDMARSLAVPVRALRAI